MKQNVSVTREPDAVIGSSPHRGRPRTLGPRLPSPGSSQFGVSADVGVSDSDRKDVSSTGPEQVGVISTLYRRSMAVRDWIYRIVGARRGNYNNPWRSVVRGQTRVVGPGRER